MTTVRGLGEFGLIDRIVRQIEIASNPPAELLVGVGDDAAAWLVGDSIQLASTDTLVSPWDFLPDRVDWQDLGWKALAVNVSDIAAMGGTPRWALVTAALPPDFSTANVAALYEGILECATRFGIQIIGGDIARSEETVLTVTLLGQAERAASGDPLLLLRSAGRPGDTLAVTGPLGASAGGLRLVLEGGPRVTKDEQALLHAHYRPMPRVEAGRRLVAIGFRAGMDISDGLVADAGKLAKASGCRVVIRADAVPVAPALARRFPEAARALALGGGEDFELLVTAGHALLERAAQAGVPLVTVGKLIDGEPGSVEVLDEHGGPIAIETAGWEQFTEAGE